MRVSFCGPGLEETSLWRQELDEALGEVCTTRWQPGDPLADWAAERSAPCPHPLCGLLHYLRRARARPRHLQCGEPFSGAAAAASTVDLIAEAVGMRARHTLMGRLVEYGLRELVISRGRTGHAARYSVEDAYDAVLVLAIRHQRDIGYWGHGEDKWWHWQ